MVKWQRIDGLGIGGAGLTTMPFTSPSLTEQELDKAPSCTFSVEASGSDCQLEVRCLPTHRIHQGRSLRYAVRVDGDLVQVIDVDWPAKSNDWNKNVIRGYSLGTSFHSLKPGQEQNILVREVITKLKDKFPKQYPGERSFEDGRLHSLRHYFCSTCANTGIPKRIVMSWLGHADSEMVRHCYHLNDEESQQKMDQLKPSAKKLTPGMRTTTKT